MICFSRGQASTHCITSSKEQEALSIRGKQTSVVLRTVYTVGIAAFASILLSQTSWLSRSAVELNLWFVLIFCLRSYHLFNYSFLLKDLEHHEIGPLHQTTTTDLGVPTLVSRLGMCIPWHQDVDPTAMN